MRRDAMLGRLSDERFDVLVIGGGATGLGCAVDAASRGYRTALVEAHDFAEATSSRSTKLVHGGVRYLAQGQIGLVREALHERTNLLRNAPAIAHERAFLTPAYRWYEAPYYYTGLRLYDALAGGSNLGRSRRLRASQATARSPRLRRAGLRAAIEYRDGQFDDARLAIALARTAASHGAALANYAAATALLREGSRVAGARVRDEERGATFEVRATATIAAAGIFADDVRRLDDPQAPALLAHSRGTHLCVSRDAYPGEHALLVPKTDDGRVLFVIPWHEHVLIGTTDVAVARAELNPQPTPEEIAYLLQTVNRYLEAPIEESAIRAAWAGLRPLVERGARSTARESREHLVAVSASGLVTIAGGKWTTYRKMAQDAVDAAVASAGLAPAPCVTASLRLLDDPRDDLAAIVAERADLAEPLCPGFSYTKADVVNGFRNEMARTAQDVLARRTRLAFLDRAAAESARATVAELAAYCGGRP
ncbi:MAG TPA: glycerol-3-phosphate dehydrogenase/oxidase [Verrucomicrobiae bacterium]|nr:glycerol-3-phosphate dehydrogenase/oxidase [Verrucomicrobiae bacterium]